MRHVNIPIFIPHLGCPNQCIFCNQRFISGTQKFEISNVKNQIERTLSTINDGDFCEIAFFGGSFTGIDRNLMISLLDIAEEYVRLGRVNSIRMSTRPDYISIEILTILQKYSISYIELGIQTMNDSILALLKRGHSVEDTERAIKLIKDYGFKFIGQMMVGLPGSTIEDELYCADKICSLGASGVRIYPTIVFQMTELADMYYNGEYNALSIEEAVERASKVLRTVNERNVPCIRIGLCDSENLHSDETFIAGPNAPSIGEMVKSKVFYDTISENLGKQKENIKNKSITIECAVGLVSQVIGNKKTNINKLKNQFGISDVKVLENPSLSLFEINIMTKEENPCD